MFLLMQNYSNFINSLNSIERMFNRPNNSGNPYSSFQSYRRDASGSMSKTVSNFNHQSGLSRSPLYPIGPSLSQQQFHPVRQAPSQSPYLTSKQGIRPPSYEQKYFRTQMSLNGQRTLNGYNHELREKQLIDRNENQIKQEIKRRNTLQTSYEREIQNLNKTLNRNLQRKQTLLAEIQNLQNIHSQYNERLSGLIPPKVHTSTYEPLDRKQQQIILTKNKLLTEIRQKEEDYMKEEEQEEKYWEQQIKEKEKIFMRTEQITRMKRLELHATKTSLEKPDFYAIQDEVRESKYQDFIYESSLLEERISKIIKQRQNQQREVEECLKSKKQHIHSLFIKHSEVTRECTTSRIRAEELQRVSKQMSTANDNLMKELQRKQKMIDKYELDIHSLKTRKEEQQMTLNTLMNQARDKQQDEMQRGIQEDIQKAQQEIRHQTSITNKLKSQYQKLYEMLCSTSSKNIHETFNETLVV